MNSRYRKHKWKKYKFMKRSYQLAGHLPQTREMKRKALYAFIKNYNHVILKPADGSGGFGVMKVSSIGNDEYVIHSEKNRIMVQGKKSLYAYVKNKMGSRSYLVQRYITLAKVRHRPFDIRVIVQRRKDTNLWEVTAMVAKVAGKGYFVTNNTRSKGTMLHVETAIQRFSIDGHSLQILLSHLKRVALLSAQRLSKLYPDHRIYGLDMGLDQSGHIWIIEANLRPAMSHFLKLGDMAMCRRIRAYKKG
jgi:hypothetical protein